MGFQWAPPWPHLDGIRDELLWFRPLACHLPRATEMWTCRWHTLQIELKSIARKTRNEQGHRFHVLVAMESRCRGATGMDTPVSATAWTSQITKKLKLTSYYFYFFSSLPVSVSIPLTGRETGEAWEVGPWERMVPPKARDTLRNGSQGASLQNPVSLPVKGIDTETVAS